MKKFKKIKLLPTLHSTFHIPYSTSGFTLIEMLVVIFMIGIISTISITNFRAAERSKRVLLASDIVVNAIRNTQNFTLTGKNNPGTASNCQTPRYVVNILYPNRLTIYEWNSCGGYDQVETFTLPANTRFQANGLKLNGVNAAIAVAFYFTPPFASMTAQADSGGKIVFTTATLTVESTDGVVSKTVTVDGVSGRIGE